MKKLTPIIESKRNFLKLSTILPLTLALKDLPFNHVSSIFLDDDIVIINGWVLLKSDFIQS